MKRLILLVLLSLPSLSVAQSTYVLDRAIALYSNGTRIDTQAGNGWTASGTMSIGGGRITQNLTLSSNTSCQSVALGADVLGLIDNQTTARVLNDNGIISEFTVISLSPLTTIVQGDGFVEVDVWLSSALSGGRSAGGIDKSGSIIEADEIGLLMGRALEEL